MEDIIRTSKEFVVIDIETSHFSPLKGAMIIEIGAVKIRDGKIVAKKSQFIDPERKLSDKITEITGIVDADLKGQPKYRQVLPKLYEFIGDATIVAHNAHFDWNTFLLYFFDKVGITPNNRVVDTLVLSRKYLKNASKCYKLGFICEQVGVSLEGAHRALDDATATAELFLYIKDKYIHDDDQIKIELPEAPAPRTQAVRKVSYWMKELKDKGPMERLYVTLDRSTVFYDIPSKAWEIKSTSESVDFKKIEADVLSFEKAENMDELLKRFG